jgi:hypothetical protein
MISFKRFLPGKKTSAFYGKVRIPTIGHAKVVDSVKEHAKKTGGEVSVGLSGADKPLPVDIKKSHAEKLFGTKVDVGAPHTKTLVSYLSHLHQTGTKHLTLFAGSDRAKEYHTLISKYNGKADKKGNVPFHFKSFKVNKVGADREEGEINKHPKDMSRSELEQTVSASRLEKIANSGDYESFKHYHPGLKDSHVKSVYDAIRSEKK